MQGLTECLQGRILIRHSQFLGGGHTERNACGASGTAIIRTISAVNNTLFTTQLTIFANQWFNGRTVKCVSDRGRVIGQSQIWLMTGKGSDSEISEIACILNTDAQLTIKSLASAPRVSSLSFAVCNVRQQMLTFIWRAASDSCPATEYKIISRNCGDCPWIVNSTSVTCNDYLMSTQVTSICTFTVQPVGCIDILGEAANPITVIMNSNCFTIIIIKIVICICFL